MSTFLPTFLVFLLFVWQVETLKILAYSGVWWRKSNESKKVLSFLFYICLKLLQGSNLWGPRRKWLIRKATAPAPLTLPLVIILAQYTVKNTTSQNFFSLCVAAVLRVIVALYRKKRKYLVGNLHNFFLQCRASCRVLPSPLISGSGLVWGKSIFN